MYQSLAMTAEIRILGQNPLKQYPPGQTPPPDKTSRSQNPP